MNNLTITLLGTLLATNTPAAVSNLVVQKTGISINIPDPNDPVEKEYKRVLESDDDAQADVDKWIEENRAFQKQGGGTPEDLMNKRIEDRFAIVRKAYEDFLEKHPRHAAAHLAYGSFLMEAHDEQAGVREMEKARELDPKNPAAWNNLANHFGHEGEVKKAFEYYAKAIEINPSESVYYQNLAAAVYLFRSDAKEYYKISEPQVFEKALELYKKALKLDPKNFPLATDLAQNYYAIKPVRTDEALGAWTNALAIAHDDVEREGVFIHLARFKMSDGRFGEARRQLDSVTNSMYADLKKRLLKNLNEQEKFATNALNDKLWNFGPARGLRDVKSAK